MSAEDNASQKVGNHIVSLRKTAGLLAAFGLMVGLIGGGIGANFFDSVTAEENINVGDFGCAITNWTDGSVPGDLQANGYHSISYTAPTILSSAPSSAPFTFQVTNTGDMTAVLTITESPALSSPWSYIPLAPASPVSLAAGASQAFVAGIQWTELFNSDLGASGTATWTVNCGEAPAVGVDYFTTTGNGAVGSTTGFCRYATPQASVALGDGTASQVVSGGAVTLSVGSPLTGYGDTGFYKVLGTLGSLTSYSITSSGSPIGTNLYFDTSGDSAFFDWNGSNCWTGLNGDTYAAGGGATGTYTVNSATPFYVLGGAGAGSTFTLAQLQAGDDTGISTSTLVAVWVGITGGIGDTLSSTITAAP